MTDSTINEAPSVSPERFAKFYQDLAVMQTDLDADPLELGPKRLNAKTSECRGYLSKTERMFLEVSQDLHWYKREHRRSLAMFELSVQDLMTNDPEIRSGRSYSDRLAIAHTRLRKERERISTLQFAVEDLEAVITVIRTKRNDLKDIASRLRDQLKICQEEIGLGGRWGNARRVSGPHSQDVAGTPDEVNELLDGALKEMEEAKGPVEETAEPTPAEPEVTPGPDSVEDLFAKEESPKDLPTNSISDLDVDKALDGMGEHLPKPVVVEPMVDKTLDEILAGFEAS